MKRYEALTRYIKEFKGKEKEQSHWSFEDDGETVETMTHFPYPKYSVAMHRFLDELDKVIEVLEQIPGFNPTRYGSILKENGLEWSSESMSNADVSEADERLVIALLIAAVRAERFCDGVLKEFLENGSIVRWLERLAQLDSEEM